MCQNSWGKKRWETEDFLSHELYNLGHMVDAACAHYQATGSDKFLNIAKRYADCVVREVGAREGQACIVPGHQIAEMALARLFVLTGEQKYLDEAKFLLDYRGKTGRRDLYSQSDKPVTEQKEAWGHAVRAGYMYAGMADVAALTGDQDYLKAIDAIYQNIVSKKYYITGGVGARHAGEAFGADYELPNLTSYNETCAAISMVYLFHRMFLLHGDAKYIDCMERTLYNVCLQCRQHRGTPAVVWLCLLSIKPLPLHPFVPWLHVCRQGPQSLCKPICRQYGNHPNRWKERGIGTNHQLSLGW